MNAAILPLVLGLIRAFVQDGSIDRWEQAVQAAPEALRADFAFLVEHLPSNDRQEQDPEQLLEEVRLAQHARRSVPWGSSLPADIWRNDVLPHCHISEARESMRAELQGRFLARAAACEGPGEAALLLNSTLFGEFGVRYSTQRERPDQSSKRTVATGLASCTGLSILLADACRSVAVPARLTGIASWVNKNGNHTWVEIWDGTEWRFLGAAEPDAKGLDHTWFQSDAALAVAGSREHGIWAVSYAPTGSSFPLVWQPGYEGVHGVDVTSRYRSSLPANELLLRVTVRGLGGWRMGVPIEVKALDGPQRRYKGMARGEGADLNDRASFSVDPSRSWQVSAGGAQVALEPRKPGVLDVELLAGPSEDEVEEWLTSDPERARQELWDAYARSPEALAMRADLDGDVVRTADRQSAFVVRNVGVKPAGGWPLVIAMHGGGGTTKEFNDSQWRHMQVYYRDHPEVSGYRYLALRAPNDEWNGFYDDSIAPLIQRLVRAQVLFEGVDPSAVHAIGYSHGGYGAFVIGPKLADLFASVHASASAPTDGETRLANFANLQFSAMIGESDEAFGRVKRCRAFAAKIAGLAERYADQGGPAYAAQTEVIEGKGHGGLPDRDLLARQLLLRREVLPRHVIWEPSGADVMQQYWVSLSEPADGQRVEARIEGQRIVVTSSEGATVRLWLDERMLNLDMPITVSHNQRVSEWRLRPNLATARESLQRWGDPERIFVASILLSND